MNSPQQPINIHLIDIVTKTDTLVIDWANMKQLCFWYICERERNISHSGFSGCQFRPKQRGKNFRRVLKYTCRCIWWTWWGVLRVQLPMSIVTCYRTVHLLHCLHRYRLLWCDVIVRVMTGIQCVKLYDLAKRHGAARRDIISWTCQYMQLSMQLHAFHRF